MSKVLRMIDFDELITWEHHNFIMEEEMKQQEELEDENGWDDEQDEWEDEQDEWEDDDFTADDIPF